MYINTKLTLHFEYLMIFERKQINGYTANWRL